MAGAEQDEESRPGLRRRHAITLAHTIEVAATPEAVFRFLVEDVPRRYPALAHGHERYDVEGGGPVALGSVIDCRERAGDQEVRHRYVVHTFVPGRRLGFTSERSETFVHLRDRVLEGTSSTDVDYVLTPTACGTSIAMTIVIGLDGLVTKWIAIVLGRTRAIWARHQREELEGLARALTKASVERTGAAA